MLQSSDNWTFWELILHADPQVLYQTQLGIGIYLPSYLTHIEDWDAHV
jgi:hypothetical protein